MGFDESLAQQALSLCDGNVDLAVDRILSGHITAQQVSTNSSSSTSNQGISNPRHVVQTDISQYSLPNGRSACTCIALHTASTILQRLNGGGGENPREAITPAHLSSLVIAGVQLYNNLAQSINASSSSVEHLSPEEVLASLPDSFQMKLVNGGVRQGILTSGSGHGHGHDGPLGFKEILNGCRADADNAGEWMAAVITKTPETLCIFLPPASTCSSIGVGGGGGTNSNGGDDNRFIVIDSHPRPSLSTEGCYALFHESMDDMVQSLNMIFPVTDLGSDVGELMAAMYNSFDVYPMQSTDSS